MSWGPPDVSETTQPGKVVTLWGKRFVVVHRGWRSWPPEADIRMVPEEDYLRARRPMLTLLDEPGE